jgi:hypothetical protein
MKGLVDSYIRAGPLKSFLDLLMELQHAYQRGRFTEADHDFVQKIEGSLNQNEFGSMDTASMGFF